MGEYAMDRPTTDSEAEIKRIVDRVQLTPERIRDLQNDISHEVVARTDKIEWQFARPSRGPSIANWLWRINLDKFVQALRNALDPLGVGYCYMIRRNGKLTHLHGSRWAQLSAEDTGPVAWFVHIPMNIASVSKFVTAIAVVRLLRDLGIPLKTPVAPYLPQYWVRGSGVGAITFHDLLRHESGLGAGIGDSGAGTFAEAKEEIRKGSTGTGAGTYNYKNLNFAILRILFATLTGALPPSFEYPNIPFPFLPDISEDPFWDAVSASAYSNYVNETVFAPASLNPRDFSADSNAALAYATPPVVPGARIVDGAGACGQSGWHLGIGELVRLMNEFRTGSMMAPWRAQQLLDNMYGLDGPLITRAGKVHYKGGRKIWTTPMTKQGMDSAIYMMPGKVDFAIFVNSWDGTGPGHLGVIPQLIKDSIEFVFAPSSRYPTHAVARATP
jgi:hypothetical protein